MRYSSLSSDLGAKSSTWHNPSFCENNQPPQNDKVHLYMIKQEEINRKIDTRLLLLTLPLKMKMEES